MKKEKLKIKNYRSVAKQRKQRSYLLSATCYPLTQGVH